MKTRAEDYPFLKGGVTSDRPDDVRSIKAWLSRQPHLPQLTESHIIMFLHSNYNSLERTKTTIENYYTVRAENPDLFSNWNMEDIEKAFQIYEMAPIPRKTSEGYQVLVYRLKDHDPSKTNVPEAIKSFLAFNDIRISEDGLSPGYLVVFDMKGCTLSHLARVTAALHYLKVFMVYIQDCHPVRLKGVHVINTASFMDRVLSILKPLMHSELIHLLHLHSSLDTLSEFFPLDLLPEDYGGNSKPTSYLHDEHFKMMKKDYANWVKECTIWSADLKKRPQKSKAVNNMVGSFRSLEID